MSEIFELKVLDERLHEWGLPKYQSEMAAAIDLHACIDGPIALNPRNRPVLVSSGIAVHINDPGIVGIIVPRSGLGHKSGIVMGNLVGVIDADYTGPVSVSLWNRGNDGDEAVVIKPGDRIAQMLFLPIVRPSFRIVEEFSLTTKRGAGGFGSTGS